MCHRPACHGGPLAGTGRAAWPGCKQGIHRGPGLPTPVLIHVEARQPWARCFVFWASVSSSIKWGWFIVLRLCEDWVLGRVWHVVSTRETVAPRIALPYWLSHESRTETCWASPVPSYMGPAPGLPQPQTQASPRHVYHWQAGWECRRLGGGAAVITAAADPQPPPLPSLSRGAGPFLGFLRMERLPVRRK